jgi:small redox-active disulfide protein 2
MLTIKILGSGCPNCKQVESIARQAAAGLGIEADFVKVTDYGDILNYDVFATPGLVINEKVICTGRIPTTAEVTRWLADELNHLSIA